MEGADLLLKTVYQTVCLMPINEFFDQLFYLLVAPALLMGEFAEGAPERLSADDTGKVVIDQEADQFGKFPDQLVNRTVGIK